ncbi:hypothetical protein, partial [Methylomonas rosea]
GSAPEVDEIRCSAVLLRRQILESPAAGTLHPSARSRIVQGKSPDFLLPIKERCARAGISYKYHLGAKMFLSAYVHTHPIALHQLTNFKAGDPNSLTLLSVPIRYAMAFLAKSLELMRTLFGEVLPLPDEPSKTAIIVWAGIAAEGVSSGK